MKKLALIGFVAISFLAACKKDKNDSPAYLSSTSFNQKYSIKAQTFNDNANEDFSITGEKGIKVQFPASSFLGADGNPVSGQVKITLKEVLSKKDILFSGKMTESNGNLLISGGEFEILATQNGQKLKLNPAVNVIVKVPTTLSSEPMDIFSFTANGTTDSTWTQVQKRGEIVESYYSFILPEFGWVNCDYFYADPRPKTTITVKPNYLGNIPNIKSQSVYLIFEHLNTVIYLPYKTALDMHQSYINAMPIGETAKLVIISVDVNDKIYFGHTNISISEALHTDLIVTQANQADLDTFLATID